MKQIPGVAWVALITAIIGWLQGDWFAGQVWVPIAVIALSAVAQLVSIFVVDRGSDRALRAINGEPSDLSRFFWGG